MLQLASAGAVYPVETAPALFQALHPLLPMTYAIEAFRTLLAGGGPSVVPAAVVLLLWLAGGLAVSLAIAWHRGRERAAPEALAPA